MTMNNFIKNIICFSVFFATALSVSAQEQKKAEQAVLHYMSTIYEDYGYIPGTFGQLAGQPYAEAVEKKLGVSGKVRYSIPHTLTVEETFIQSEYFHLDENFNVLGHLSEQDMLDIIVEMFYSDEKIRELMKTFSVDTVYFEINSIPE
jgi:hypothetical protein